MNDRIIQVAVKGDQVIGITASGYLARFDENMSCWIIRGKADVYDSNSKIVVSSVTVNEPVNARQMAVKKENGADIAPIYMSKGLLWLKIFAFMMVSFFIALIVARYV